MTAWVREKADTCPTCGKWTETGRQKLYAHHRKHPIGKIDLSKPVSQLLNEIREKLILLRGDINDIRFSSPIWDERLNYLEGFLTAGVVCTYNLINETKAIEMVEK